MPQCIAETATNRRCSRQAAAGVVRCGTHHRQHQEQVREAGPEIQGRCNKIMRRTIDHENRWQRCGGMILEGHDVCHRHHNVIVRADRRIQQANQVHVRIAQMEADAVTRAAIFWNIFRELLDAGINWHEVLEAIATEHTANRINHLTVNHIIASFAAHIHEAEGVIWVAYNHIRINQLEEQQPPPPPQVDRQLQHIARDNQNVHTAPVTEQTNRGLDVLLKIEVPKNPNTRRNILIEWLETKRNVHIDDILKVYEDINHWYCMKTCRTSNDKLYRRALDGLVIMIKTHEHKVELYKRLWQECYEAKGLCCDGHINRLINVMVGFDDRFAPPVPIKEQLQQKMAALANQDITDEQKIVLAKNILVELKIPESEHNDWLSAF